MNNIVKKVRFKFRRYKSADIKNDFIPLDGEIIIIDFENESRSVIGNGKDPINKLPYTDETARTMASGIVVQGYYYDGKFYQDESHTISIIGYSNKVYIDINTRSIYAYFDAEHKFSTISDIPPKATDKVAGISKLYTELGENVDGSINQKKVTSELNKKFTITLDQDEGLIFKDGSLL